MRQFVLAAFLAFAALPSDAAERWEMLPPTPAPIPTDRTGEVEANGIKIHYRSMAKARLSSFCTAALPTPTTGVTRFQPWPRITP